MLIGDIISVIEQYAPLPLQEDYDNCGLQVGSKSTPCSGVLLCVDVSPSVVDEAIERGCNLIVTHHPLLFKGLKRITGATLVEQVVIKAIAANVAIYSSHTAMDNALGGVSWQMASRLSLTDVQTLERQTNRLLHLSVMVPNDHVDRVSLALFEAGAGKLGNYDCCRFAVEGQGSFRALEGADPFVGNLMEVHNEPETRISVVLPSWLKDRAEAALLEAHPYEVPAYEFVAMQNSSPTGSGVVGNLSEPVSVSELIAKIKQAYGSPVVRCTAFDDNMMVRRVAMCGGAGAFLIKNAIASKAQVFITSDSRYHDFIDNAANILLIDIGHYESEQCTKDIFYRIITENFANFAVYYSETEQNPINYL